MIEKYVSDVASQMGINLTQLALEDGHALHCLDVHLLSMSSKGHKVSTLIFRADLENLVNGVNCERLETRTRAALSRLQIMLEP